jgi:hypothetical protein
MPELPQIDGAMVRPLGDAEHTSTQRDGRPYGMIEQRFVIFPERSGDLTIPPASVSGSINVRSGGGYSGRRIGIDVSSETIVVPVLPVPASYPKDAAWLPATAVDLMEDWPDEPQRGLTVGIPSQRTVIARADGNVASAIPPLTPAMPRSIKTYPESPSLNEVQTVAGMIGTRAETMSLVAMAPGRITLPAVQVVWWDTVNDTVMTATLPAHDVAITGTASSTPRTANPASVVPQPEADATASHDTARVAPDSGTPRWQWMMVVLGALALSGLTGALGLAVVRRRWPRRPHRALDSKAAERLAYRAFEKACTSGDATQIRAALDQWLTICYAAPLPQATVQFARNDGAREALNQLNRVLYQQHQGESADVAALRACVSACRTRTIHPQRGVELPALYPSA